MRRLQLPFVITVAASACGGTTIVDGGAGGASTTSSSGTTSTGSTGGASPTTSSSGTGGTDNCPAEPPADGFSECTLGSSTCTYEVACASGPVTLAFSCTDNGYWNIGPEDCGAFPNNHCPGTWYHCPSDNGWWMPEATNPPSPCPETAPPPGEPCNTDEFGGVWPQCGYRCGGQPDGAWTIATCENGPVDGSWSYDDACD